MSRIEKALEKASRQRDVTPPVEADIAPAKKIGKPPVAAAENLIVQTPLKVDNPILAALREKNDVIAEEYKKLRSVVLQLTRKEKFRNTLMVTSAVSGEGKTITALNLAISLAKEYDHTVLLVDTDLRRPSIHKYLGLEPKAGLIQYLKGKVSLDEVLIKTGIGKLVVLPAGGTLDDPVEVLSSNRMKEVIQELKGRYPDRYVIFDSPPMLPFADARVLKDSVDASLFVVRERKVKLEHVRKVISDLGESKLLGVVYNDIQSFSSKSRYYYY